MEGLEKPNTVPVSSLAYVDGVSILIVPEGMGQVPQVFWHTRVSSLCPNQLSQEQVLLPEALAGLCPALTIAMGTSAMMCSGVGIK